MANPILHNSKGSGAAGADDNLLCDLYADAVVFEGARRLGVRRLALNEPAANDVVVDVDWSAVSTGTEKLLWAGDMPTFPGMNYPLVPGYEAVGRVVWAKKRSDLLGRLVFAPGSRAFKDAHGLFGAAATRIVTDSQRVTPIDLTNPKEAVLLALAATAHHAVAAGSPPDLIVGHGVLGRLLARVSIALGAPPPVVWEIDPMRADADGYPVIAPDDDGRQDYQSIYDASGDPKILDTLVSHLKPAGEIVLAGFYADRPSFAFPPAFMKEMRLRISAEWKPEDLSAILALMNSGALSFDGLITHTADSDHAEEAYRTAFEDPTCLKMVLDWRGAHGPTV